MTETSAVEFHSQFAEEAEHADRVDRFADLQLIVSHAAHLLPSQGPITVFVHHNTLHAFEELGFDEGVKAGGLRFGCHAYLPEEDYQNKLRQGRIRMADLEAVVIDDLGDCADQLVAIFGTRFALRLAMLQFPLRTGPVAELRWVIAETDALRRFRSDVEPAMRDRLLAETRRWIESKVSTGELTADRPIISTLDDVFEQFDRRTIATWSERTWEAFCLNFLWRVCRAGVERAIGPEMAISRDTASVSASGMPVTRCWRHRDLLYEATGEDADQPVHDVLIRFCAAFLDQGFAAWELPQRGAGFFRSFLSLYQTGGTAATGWRRRLQQEVRRLSVAAIGPLESLDESLTLLGVAPEEREEFVTQSLLALRGWAGMVWQMESNAEWAPRPSPPGSLVEFLAVRLLLDRLSIEEIACRAFGRTVPLAEVRRLALERIPAEVPAGIDQRTFTVFQLAQVRGWPPHHLQNLTHEQWAKLVAEIDLFPPLARRRVYHLAFERKYRNEALDAMLAHRRRALLKRSSRSVAGGDGQEGPIPAYQVVCCIDDREESFRRHLEEVDPECETFGVAGFFGVAMYYRGVGDAHFRPLCPVNMKPEHYVVEEPLYSSLAAERFRAETRRRIGWASHHAHRGTRTFLGGLVAGLLGSLAAFPLVARVLFPRTTAQLRRWARGVVHTPGTALQLERIAGQGSAGTHDEQHGYTVREMADIVKAILVSSGIVNRCSRLVVFLGHGSTSLNNPHESAYCCGACSGSRGGPNARAFAQMANDYRVRAELRERGIRIPDGTVFVGGYHDTTNDRLEFADLDCLPRSHRPHFERALAVLDETRARNAQERCRRFESADPSISKGEALRHVEARPEDLSQARPEYNHATCALCLVGRREWSRGLFLDRRSFLTSYDPREDDPQGSVLESILRAVIPVCAGISLEYYFSTIDPEGYGSGSKLPHNITSLLGVMTGAASDLRPGLSNQMTEIHEPVRLLFVIETTPAAMRRIIHDNPAIARLVNGAWVQLAVFDAEAVQMHRYVRGEFVRYEPESTELPVVRSSVDWYAGTRDHLGFASISGDALARSRSPGHDEVGCR
jgi:hypothetical protein